MCAWKFGEKPEYRGFRCGNCQAPLHKAWHHWYVESGYKTPVHLCNNCEFLFKFSKIRVNELDIFPNKMKFSLKLPEEIKNKLKEIISGWNTSSKPFYKTFTCDNCARNIHKAYHFWFMMEETLAEVHFCKKCGDKLGLNELM
jgi:hypothetical protein